MFIKFNIKKLYFCYVKIVIFDLLRSCKFYPMYLF